MFTKCDGCGADILFGGVKEYGLRFCGKKCRERNMHLVEIQEIAEALPVDAVEQALTEHAQVACPKCGGEGPIDLHTSHAVWSIMVLTSWKSTPEVCCRGCGTKSKLVSIATSGLFGWWGFPWGLLVTPIQISRNVYGLVASSPSGTSPRMRESVKRNLASQIYQRRLEQSITSTDN